jgi:hypothetical protein
MEWQQRKKPQQPLCWAMRFEIWAVGSVQEKEDPSQPLDLGEKVHKN